MPHIHELIDFTVGAYIVHRDRVLLIHHRKLEMWICVGGHIELDEDSDQALFREVEEETGLKPEQIEVLSVRPSFPQTPEVTPLLTPNFVDIHKISDTHRHIALFYFVKADTDKVKLAAKEHYQIKWFTKEELDDPYYKLWDSVKFYSHAALKAAAEK